MLEAEQQQKEQVAAVCYMQDSCFGCYWLKSGFAWTPWSYDMKNR